MSIGSNATANGYNITYKSVKKKKEELDLYLAILSLNSANIRMNLKNKHPLVSLPFYAYYSSFPGYSHFPIYLEFKSLQIMIINEKHRWKHSTISRYKIPSDGHNILIILFEIFTFTLFNNYSQKLMM